MHPVFPAVKTPSHAIGMSGPYPKKSDKRHYPLITFFVEKIKQLLFLQLFLRLVSLQGWHLPFFL